MKETAGKVCLVIPCYNEANRLDFERFNHFKDEIFFIFVNDGSTDNTLELLKKHESDSFYVLNLEKNSGKAEAVRQGILYSRSLPFFEKIYWVGYWDADLSTPLEELENFLAFASLFYPEADAIFGSRMKRAGSIIERSVSRHIIGRIFATFFSLLFNIKTYDSQCGAKLFNKNLLDSLFSEPFVSRWLFDVEIILRGKEFQIREYPLRVWKDVSGSKISALDLPRILLDMLRIRRKYGGM